MKKLIFLYGLVFMLWGITCCVQHAVTSNQISYLGQDVGGTVKVRVTGYGQKQFEIQNDAAFRAFEQLIYVGLPDATNTQIRNTDFRLPLIENKAKVESLPQLKAFFEKEEYNRFITNTTPLESIKKLPSSNLKSIPFAITINYDGLRRHMEQIQVIRKFGY